MEKQRKCRKCGVEITQQNSVNIRINRKTGIQYIRSICKKCRNRETSLTIKKNRKIFGTYPYFYRKLEKIRHSARLRGKTCNLNVNDIRTIMTERRVCFYCGKNPFRPTFDRVDNSLGYTLENIVVACLSCNSIKSKASRKDIEKRIALLQKILKGMR